MYGEGEAPEMVWVGGVPWVVSMDGCWEPEKSFQG